MLKRKNVAYGSGQGKGFTKRRRTGFLVSPAVVNRRGYGSVARARGAAVIGEMKYFDSNLTNTALVATTGTWPVGTMVDPTATINLGDIAVVTPLCLFAPKVSAALNGRIGRKVKILKIKMTGLIQIPVQAAQATSDASTCARLILVLDTQTNSAQMTAAQLLQDADSATTSFNSFQNVNNFGRFRVLKQKYFTFSNPNIAGSPTTGDLTQGSITYRWKINHKFKIPLDVMFNATNGGTVADIINNSLHLVCGANSIAMAPSISYYCRINYKE